MDKFTRESLRGDMDDVVYKKSPMKFSELDVREDGNQPQVVLIEGAPGVGKTTFAWYIPMSAMGRGQAAAGLLHCATTATPQGQQHQTNQLTSQPLPSQ